MTLPDTQTSRVLEWEGCHNVRDLGGLATLDGRRTRWGALVRSDLLCRLTETGQTALVDHAVRTIVDLRFPDEVAHDWHLYPFRDVPDGTPKQVRYSNVPFNTGRDPALNEEIRAAYRAATSRTELNRLDLDRNATGIAAAVSAIADAPPGGVLVHCHGGKDRTGIVVALILSALGVSDDEIADDYALTAINLEPLIVEWLDGITDEPAERDRLRALAMPAREAMLETLAHLAKRFGSAEEYLREAGVTDAQLRELRTRLLEVPER
ncbi:MAG: tyrosine-protein phosphatase [Chloroflexota bacterium]